MQATSHYKKGIFLALCAAALNASIGIFSKILMQSGFSSSSIALIKTALGCAILMLLAPYIRAPATKASWLQAAICALLGIFVLYHFETASYQHYASAGVVVILMASAAASAIILGRIVLHEPITANALIGVCLAVLGVCVIFGMDIYQGFSFQGAAFAFIAGSGYGAFSVAMKHMGLSGGLYLTRQLLFFGSLFLLMPASIDGFVLGSLTPVNALLLLGLATLPTVLGFFCTTKAIEYIKPSQVQTIELTEPLFATAFAFILLNETPAINIYIGGFFIIVGLLVSNNPGLATHFKSIRQKRHGSQ